jgi:DNA-binding MltR family transcriptional regulator
MVRKKKPDPLSETFVEKMQLVYDESDRGAVVVGACLVEEHLDSILWTTFGHQGIPKKVIESMFDLAGPLGTFAAKAKTAYAFGLISKETYEDIERIRALRNDAAHTGTGFTLSGAKRKAKIMALRHAVQYDDESESDAAMVAHEKYVWGLCVGATCIDIFRDFDKYNSKQLKIAKVEYQELLMRSPAFKHGLLSGMLKTPAGRLKGLLDP